MSNGRWVNRSPRTILETFHWFRDEDLGLIVNAPDEGLLVEGFQSVSLVSARTLMSQMAAPARSTAKLRRPAPSRPAMPMSCQAQSALGAANRGILPIRSQAVAMPVTARHAMAAVANNGKRASATTAWPIRRQTRRAKST